MGKAWPAGRSGLFHVLARDYRAGGHARLAAQLSGSGGRPLRMMAHGLRSGQTLGEAGLLSGVLRPWEARLLAAGSAHGRLDRALDDLARYHERANDWWGRLRIRLLFPLAVLVLGWLALPLPQLIAGQLTAQAYLLQNLLLAVMLGVLGFLPGAAGLLRRWQELVLPFRGLGEPVWQYQRYRFLRRLAFLHEAGLAMLDAVPVAVNGCDSALLRRQWSPITGAIRHGDGVAAALYRYGAIDTTGHALVLSGEASGRLGEMLSREARRLEQIVILWLDSLVDWLPRLAYVLVLLVLFSR
jgi:general secretion pathway protein F